MAAGKINQRHCLQFRRRMKRHRRAPKSSFGLDRSLSTALQVTGEVTRFFSGSNSLTFTEAGTVRYRKRGSHPAVATQRLQSPGTPARRLHSERTNISAWLHIPVDSACLRTGATSTGWCSSPQITIVESACASGGQHTASPQHLISRVTVLAADNGKIVAPLFLSGRSMSPLSYSRVNAVIKTIQKSIPQALIATAFFHRLHDRPPFRSLDGRQPYNTVTMR